MAKLSMVRFRGKYEDLGKVLLLLAVLSFLFVNVIYIVMSQCRPRGEMVYVDQVQQTARIMLIPLDSRPPCKQLVVDNGRTGGIEVVVPPPEILDYYTESGNTAAIADWAKQTMPTCDGAIVSIDQLLYGGLLNSREKQVSNSDIEGLVELLKQLRYENPGKSIYAFNIVPRMNPPASMEDYDDIISLMAYSRLTDAVAHTPYNGDLWALVELKSESAPELFSEYEAKYGNNFCFNLRLAELIKEGTLDLLVLGQDDGEPYSLPNLYLRRLEAAIKNYDIGQDKLIVTHGADEIAVTLLARWQLSRSKKIPKIYTAYSDSYSANAIMPYMAVNQQQCIAEKVSLIGAQLVDDMAEADMVLLTHCGDGQKEYANLQTGSDQIDNALKDKALLEIDKPLAIVDISKHYRMGETLFAKLLNMNYPINGLVAYGGWNTASNSIGTVLAQSTIYISAIKMITVSDNFYSIKQADKQAVMSITVSNLKNLNNRFLEDYYYLKCVIDAVNGDLAALGYNRYSVLDPAFSYLRATKVLQQNMDNAARSLSMSNAWQQPFSIPVFSNVNVYDGYGADMLRLYGLRAETSFPWPRTFEVYLESDFWGIFADR